MTNKVSTYEIEVEVAEITVRRVIVEVPHGQQVDVLEAAGNEARDRARDGGGEHVRTVSSATQVVNWNLLRETTADEDGEEGA